MPEKRLWPNVAYIFLISVIFLTIWQIFVCPKSISSQLPENSIAAYTLYTQNSTRYTHPMHLLPKNDYNQLINISYFTFRILNLVCNDSHPFLLILVHSTPVNFNKRQTIRETWGRNTNQIRLLFMIGLMTDAKLQKTIDEENQIYSDIVQGTFLDTYRNLTYKHVMLFKYAIYHCPKAKYILKTDDDIFVNMPTMMNFLKLDLSPYGSSRLLMCTKKENSPVSRSYRSKWRVSFSEYSNKTYPTYCLGWSLLYSPDVIFDLYREAQKTKYFWIDDAHITGVLAQKLRIVHTNSERLVIYEKQINYTLKYSENLTDPFLYGFTGPSTQLIRNLWDYVNSRSVPKYILKYLQEKN